ncbi:hypothetical protein PCC7424_3780 [Gloeothece citriformis PCC 7424]|uniref:Uncharacterized protein n=1 Tax=Gloeothece citriformis (strain PCC 7424) TaxID=65393 RepID=B7KJ77_GLOC7|nr:hypothetical protein [Gloeothece citriformis]ACK72161.1 hypothetical protein PCC7424_3780 [Gloeothece citriformis PCC 7424]
MKKITGFFFTIPLFLLSVVILTGQPTKASAQIRGQGTEPFFDRGNQQIEREIERLQQQQEEDPEQKQQALDLEEQPNSNNQTPENEQPEQTVPATDTDSNLPESQDKK